VYYFVVSNACIRIVVIMVSYIRQWYFVTKGRRLVTNECNSVTQKSNNKSK
jgi:hypothetical protein